MFLKLDELQVLHARWEEATLDELNQEIDGYSNELASLAEPISEPIKAAILSFLQVVPMASGFGVSSSIVRLYKKLTNHEPVETDVITSADYRVLQKVIVDSKPTNIQQMSAVDGILQALNHVSVKFGILEEKSQYISVVITRKDKEQQTGLEFSAEDNANVRPTEENTPAELHVVKDAPKKAAKVTKTSKAKAEKA